MEGVGGGTTGRDRVGDTILGWSGTEGGGNLGVEAAFWGGGGATCRGIEGGGDTVCVRSGGLWFWSLLALL